MRTWFGRRALAGGAPVAAADPAVAYQEGRADGRVAAGAGADRADLRAAYDRGVREERLRRRRSPAGAVLMVVLLVAVLGQLFLVARYGSFTGAGAVIDGALSITADRAAAPVRGAEDKAGAALTHAGEKLQSDSQSSAN